MKSAGKTFFKNLILALTLVIIVLLFCIAWFSGRQEASASGLTVKSGSASGLESSLTGFDGTDWSSEHTKDLSLAFPLITGDGQKFFLPALNLSTGSPDYTGADPNSNWLSKREVYSTETAAEANANPDYIEQDIYFRSEQPLSVYLRQDSTVTSDNIEAFKTGQPFGNISLYGSFPTDFIAATARVSFSEVVTENNTDTERLKYVWAPNDTYELVGDGSFTELEPESSGTGEGFNPPSTDGWGIVGNSDRYMWVAFQASSSFSSTNPDDPDMGDIEYEANRIYYSEGIRMMYDETDQKYYAVIDAPINTSGASQLYFYVNQITGTVPDDPPTDGYNGNIAQQSEYSQYDFTRDGKSYFVRGRFTGQIAYVNDSGVTRQWAELFMDTSAPSLFQNTGRTYDRYQLKIAYWEDNDGVHLELDKFVYYDYSNPSDYGGTGMSEAGGSEGSNYYLKAGDSIIISSNNNDGENYAFTPYASKTLSSYSLSDGKITAYDPNSVFIVEKAVETDADDKLLMFYLKHRATGKYLYIDTGTETGDFILSDTQKKVLFISSSSAGPAIGFSTTEDVTTSDLMFLDYSDNLGFFQSISRYSLKIYKGSSYNISTEGTKESSYQYYDTNNSSLTTLSNVKLTDNLDDVPIVTLVKRSDTDQYYTAHIRVRIWAEGTDREAKTPLAGGTFNTHLVFEGILSQSDGS